MRIIFVLIILIITSLLLKMAATGEEAEERRTQVKHPPWSEKAVIYELNTRSFTPEGTFNAIIPRVKELKALGVDIIWFMPIHPIGEKKRKGDLGSPYSVSDYYAINPEFGTMRDFKALVKAFHDAGMHVIIDLVANHTSWDSLLVKEHEEWFRKRKDGSFVPPVPDWDDVVHLDYSKDGLREYMYNVMEFWVKEAGIDGYRCDVAAMVPTSFWNEARRRLKKIKPVFMLAEAEKPELLVEAFDCDYASEIYCLFNEIAMNRKKPAEISRLIDCDSMSYPEGSWRMLFITNHDQNSWHESEIKRLGPRGSKAFALLTFTLPGKPLIYNGQEIGNRKKLQFFSKDPIIWEESPYRAFYKKLCQIHKSHPALYRGALEPLSTAGDPDIYAFVRRDKRSGEAILVVSNLSDAQAEARLTLKGKNLKLWELFEEREYAAENPFTLRLNPWEYKVYLMKTR